MTSSHHNDGQNLVSDFINNSVLPYLDSFYTAMGETMTVIKKSSYSEYFSFDPIPILPVLCLPLLGRSALAEVKWEVGAH